MQHGMGVDARIANIEMNCISPSHYPDFYILKAKYYSRFSNVLYIFIKTVLYKTTSDLTLSHFLPPYPKSFHLI